MTEKGVKASGHSQELLAQIEALLPQCMLRDRQAVARQLKGGRRKRRPDVKTLHRLKDRAEASALLLERRRVHQPEITYPEELPLSERKAEILEAIRAHPVVIVAGETGSGKTTQLPKICLEAGRGLAARIACTQPRRVAALSVSKRIAEELNVAWGKEVGCKIRFADETAPETFIKMMTDGMLLAETQNDPDLYEYDTIIIDEAHERSLNIDFLLGYLRLLRKRRPDLKIIITSATIDTKTFSEAFDNAPVIEVSGRVYPVEVRYWPLEEMGEGVQDYTYIDAAVDAVDRVLEEPGRGDVLMFMPTEKDIHETRRRLEGRSFSRTDILPLFGRLTASDQQKVFQPQRNRRIIVATNIAETSLTIPNIKYVIDPGLARISRYNPRTQTHRLPIEPIAQSSARQRAGRCGRVSGGICIRLYNESDLNGRLEYTPPEIQRSNLAEVILRMLSLRLGDIYDFPFLDPPRRQAIQGGFQLLAELGAIDDHHKLTALGRDMARLPIAPTVSRMVLQAQKEGALREVLVIASAISIQDPRIRPLEQQQQADQEHRKFLNKSSDFLTLLNIWNAYHDTFEHLQTQNAMRRFCRQHYLSYNRMREWRDIYTQIRRTLRELRNFRLSKADAHYDAVHRAVLTGLMSNIAEKKESNFYRAARSREVMLFPGSGLFQRRPEKDKKQKKAPEEDTKKQTTPAWIMAAEMVETSRLYARTVAGIQQKWLAELGGHLCKASYKEPAWSSDAGRVLVTETMTLYGLQVAQKRVGYGRIDPKAATELFIREALVNDDLRARHPFLAHNRQVRQQAEIRLMQHRQAHWIDLDDAVFRFYEHRLEDVSSVHDLNRLMKDKRRDEPEFLFMQISDLLDDAVPDIDPAAFPEYLTIEGEELPLSYACRPGQDHDGVTLTLPWKLAHFIQPEMLDWLVPGLLQEKITALLRGLPGSIRKQFVPIPDTARRIAGRLEPTHPSLHASLSAYMQQQYDVDIDPEAWVNETLPDHLKMRVEITGKDGKPVMEGRDFDVLLDGIKDRSQATESAAWRGAAAKWEHHNLTGWPIGDLPERVEVESTGSIPVYGYPGLEEEYNMVHVRLFRTREEAEQRTRAGLVRLLENALGEEMAWLRRDLKDLRDMPDLAAHVGGAEQLEEMAYQHLKTALFTREPLYPLTAARFEEDLEEAGHLIKKLPGWFMTQIRTLSAALREVRQDSRAYPDMQADLNRLLPPDFLRRTPAVQLPHLVRYLKAVRLRAERAKVDPVKDRRKFEQIKPFEDALTALEQQPGLNPRLLDDFRWLLEEYRVSIFAQDLGAAQPVSAKRLQARLDAIGAEKR